MLYCKDCKWIRLVPVDGNADYSKCSHPSLSRSGKISLVTGEEIPPVLPYADSVRSNSGSCGPDANLFEELSHDI